MVRRSSTAAAMLKMEQLVSFRGPLPSGERRMSRRPRRSPRPRRPKTEPQTAVEMWIHFMARGSEGKVGGGGRLGDGGGGRLGGDGGGRLGGDGGGRLMWETATAWVRVRLQ